jgi:hypothetical protein
MVVDFIVYLLLFPTFQHPKYPAKNESTAQEKTS